MSLPRDYTYEEVAEAIGVSKRWLQQKVSEGAAHQRYGYRTIRFTAEQVEALRADYATNPPTPASITTGRKRRSA
jgi:hypothetical protein